MKNKLKRGETIVVIAGDDKGRSGKILSVVKNGEKVVVENIAIVKKHVAKSQNFPEGGIVEKPMPIHRSNVMLKAEYDRRHMKS